MKQQCKCKMILIFAITMLLTTNRIMSQVAPPGKYNITNYPEDRKAIEALAMNDSSVHLNDDYIAVGPEGKVS